MFKAWRKQRNRKRLKDEAYAFLFEPYDGDEVVVFDTETTGLDPKTDEIVSIGAVKVKGNRILTSETFEVYLKTSRPIPAESIEVHGIRPCDLEYALSPPEGIEKFLHFIGPRPLAGYYLEFDVAMINRYIKPWLGVELPNPKTEVSGLYFDKKNFGIPQGNIDLRFDTILANLGVPPMGRHNAVNDAIMTAMIFIKLNNTIKLKTGERT
ncbi:3'-5' exonuclease [Sulfurimonas diazotrophicus]|uniref:3'-5' exonuclease n=1 Tax=Sulfurimonas diazotrophicus TaxID=3131939 RepID=A0ABZ3H868_9BACT